MALTIGAYTDSATVSTSEYSLPNDSTSLSAITTDGIYQLSVYVASMAAGDQFRFRVYEKLLSGGSQRTVFDVYVDGPQSGSYEFPARALGNGWDMTAIKVAGTDRTVEWCINSVS